MEVWLPATQFMRQVLAQDERGLVRCHTTWENGELPSQNPFPHQDREKRQCREFPLQFKVQSFAAHRQLLGSHSLRPGSIACPLLLFISGSLLEPACGTHTAMGHVAARTTWLHIPGREHANAPASASPGGQERERGRGSHPESLSHLAHGEKR